MFSKIKSFLLGRVILKKVAGKFAKHATGAIIGFLAGPQIAPWVEQLGITIDKAQLEMGLIVVFTAGFGAVWNFVEHRFVKK